MKTAVVILNWNGLELLEEFLSSVVKFSPEATIYVADNASTDESVSYVQQHFPQVKIIQNKVNGGYAKGYNDALKNLSEDVFVLLNSDVEVTENWLTPVLQHFKTHPKTAVAQPKILDYKDKSRFEYAGAAGGYLDRLGYPFCRGRIFETIEKDEGQYNQPQKILWASGACLFIRRKVFWEAGGLDEDYFAHQEEIDLCWRIHNLGYHAYFIPESRIYHLGGATLNAMNPRKTYLNFRNSLFNMLKNIPGIRVYLLIFLRLGLDGLAGIHFFIEGKPKHTWAIVRAHFGFYKRFLRMHKKRKKLKPSNDDYALIESVVWQYFLSERKTFLALKLKNK